MHTPHPEFDILRALEGNVWSLWSRFGHGDECALHETSYALWLDTPIPIIPYNAVLRFTAEHDVDRRIDDLFDHYRQRGVPFFWLLHPSSRPLDLDSRLRERGFDEVEVCAGMHMNLSDLPAQQPTPSGIHIAEATTETAVRDLLSLVAWRWNVPGEAVPKLSTVTRAEEVVRGPASTVRAWIAYRDAVPVSKVVLNLASGAAGLYGVVTKPEARGLGLARILTLEALSAARLAGYQVSILHSTPVARSLYEKIGFRHHSDFRIYAEPNSFHM
jgi:ribosomal protein S18 acetylase RimI-like enzyme